MVGKCNQGIAINTEKGNVLFLILIAVALFAALSYAVTQSSRGGGSGIDAEKSTLDAASILEYKTLLNSAIMRMKIQGLKNNKIEFTSAGVVCSSGAGCMFSADGGGLTYLTKLGTYTIQYAVNGDATTNHRAVPGMISQKQLQVHGLSLETCEEINDALGLANPPAQTGNALQFTAYPNEREACTLEWNGSEYIFYAVLVPTQ